MWSPKHEAEYRLQVAVEDRYVVLRMYEPEALLPSGDILEGFDRTLDDLPQDYITVCDLRGFAEAGAGDLTYDAIDFIRGLRGKSYCIATTEDLERLSIPSGVRVLEVTPKAPVPDYQDLNLTAFANDHDLDDAMFDACWRGVSRHTPSNAEIKFARDTSPLDEIFADDDELKEQWAMLARAGRMMPGVQEILGRRYLNQFLEGRTRNSFLHEFALHIAGDRPAITPYHSYALNTIEVANDVWIGKPAVLAGRIRAAFENELTAFEALIRGTVREQEIQEWLERHPEVFNALGYVKVFPKVVLEREEGNLIPDFILQPAGDEWCDILDIKRPEQSIVAGPSDRKRFSAAVAELQGQLREYANYFDDPKLAKAVESKYGIKCYKPKLIGVIGREIPAAETPEMRRLMTSYKDGEILPFDKLIARSRSRLLI